MTDYYSILSQAVASLDSNSAQARSALYDRARRALIGRMRTKRPPLSESAMEAETSIFEAAIDRIEAEIAYRASVAARAAQSRSEAPRRGAAPIQRHDGEPRRARKSPSAALLSVLGALAVLIIGLSGYVYMTSRSTTRPESSLGSGAVGGRDRRADAQGIDTEELEPGVDGGSTDSGLPYFYRRQPVYYRTIYSVGMLVIDRSQRFLYLIQPKISALRYGVGVGGECVDTAGLHRVVRKEEWPEWAPSPELLKRRSYPSRLAGGPGNPLGARALYLDSKSLAIHGTNAPKTIGQALSLGCFRMVNNDVIDLYNRVTTETAVVVMN